MELLPMEVVSPEINETSHKRPRKVIQRDRCLLQHIYFLNEKGSKYVSVGVYPTRDYDALVEIGKINGSCIHLNILSWEILMNHLASSSHFTLFNEHVSSKLITRKKEVYLSLTCNNQSVILSFNELYRVISLFLVLTRRQNKYYKLKANIKYFCDSVNNTNYFVKPNENIDDLDYELLYDEIMSMKYVIL